MKRRLLAGLAVVGVILTLAAGSCDQKGTGDAPVGDRHEADRQVWNMPDQFSNVAATCIGDNGVYVITADRHQVVPNDPNCERGGILYVEDDPHNESGG